MKERTRKIFIMIVMAALIVSLMAASFAALTYGRYSGGRFDENSPYGDYIDFVGATAYEVSSPEELVNAINNGYSYIKIAEGAPEPFVVNSDIADVEVNLVLDVNGHKIVRNSRNPLINVQKSVSVVLVYDSSEQAKGGFYNPVGSALQTSGGTLTVGAGVYESGPNVATQPVTTTEITDVFVRDGERALATGYKRADAVQLPELTKDVYLKNDVTEGYLRNDTYLIYTKESNCYVKGGQLFVNCTKTQTGTETGMETSGTPFHVESNVASCDFYYYYSVGEANDDGFFTYAVVYGYHDVNALASDENGAAETLQKSGLVWPYAAIRSQAGNTFARGGEFTTHFGEESTYCIYSAGGTMTVGGTAVPKFSAVQSGVCIKMVGQGTEDSLTINSGEFSSEIGNTIQMEGGKMEVIKGSFTKTGCKQGTDAQLKNQTAIISLTGGTLNVSGTKTGDTYSVTMTAGGTGNGGTLENVFGIRADGGTVTTKGVSFHIYGDYSAGVLSYDGKIDLGNDTVIDVKQSDEKKDADNDNILLTSAGVSSEQASGNEENPVNISGDVTITSNGLGITARGVVNVEGGTSTVKTTRGTGIYVNNGKFTVSSRATINVNSTVQSGYSWTTPPDSETTNTPNIYNGVYVQGGSLKSEGELNVTFTGMQNEEIGDYLTQQIKSYAVRVEAGGDANTTVTIAAGNILNGSYDENGDVKENSGVGGGVYVGGGTVTLGKQETTNGVTTYSGPTVQTTGKLLFANRNNEKWNWSYAVSNPQSWKYLLNKSGGHAVEVSGGSLTVYGGDYTAQQGNGILIRNTSDVRTTNTVKIEDGSFLGYNSGYYVAYNGQPPLGSDRMVGPAASYGLNVMGHDLDVTINGGEFGNNKGNVGNSAASFFGTSVEGTSDEIKKSRPKVAVHGGTFNAYNADAISVFRFIDITFDGAVSSEVSGETDVASLSIQEDLLYKTDGNRSSEITIQSGTFTGTAYGVYYGCAIDSLKIGNGSTFTGTSSSGLWFEVNPGNNVQLSGGTYYGPRNYVQETTNWLGNRNGIENTTSHNAIGGNNENAISFASLLNNATVQGDTQFDKSDIYRDLLNERNIRASNGLGGIKIPLTNEYLSKRITLEIAYEYDNLFGNEKTQKYDTNTGVFSLITIIPNS